jgi:hypothetical protein
MEIIDTIFSEGAVEKGRTYITATHVSQTGKRWGREWYVSVPLHLLSSISVTYIAPLGWLVFGVLAALAVVGLGVTATYQDGTAQLMVNIGAAISAVFSVICILLFFTGRKQFLVLASGSERITFVVAGTDKKLLRDFAVKVEEQQVKLLNELKGDLTKAEPSSVVW